MSMAVDSDNEDGGVLIPCDICQKAVSFAEYNDHIEKHQNPNWNNNNNNNNNNGKNDNKKNENNKEDKRKNENDEEMILIPCDHPNCGLNISATEYESHRVAHFLDANTSSLHKNEKIQVNNNNSNGHEKMKPNANHGHSNNNNKNNSNNNNNHNDKNNSDESQFIPCEYPSCNGRLIAITEYEEHCQLHSFERFNTSNNNNNNNNNNSTNNNSNNGNSGGAMLFDDSGNLIFDEMSYLESLQNDEYADAMNAAPLRELENSLENVCKCESLSHLNGTQKPTIAINEALITKLPIGKIIENDLNNNLTILISNITTQENNRNKHNNRNNNNNNNNSGNNAWFETEQKSNHLNNNNSHNGNNSNESNSSNNKHWNNENENHSNINNGNNNNNNRTMVIDCDLSNGDTTVELTLGDNGAILTNNNHRSNSNSNSNGNSNKNDNNNNNSNNNNGNRLYIDKALNGMRFDQDRNHTRGIMEALKRTLAKKPNIEYYLADSCDFYFRQYGDWGWGCGYRNLQTLCSSLLHKHEIYKNVVFNGINKIPRLYEIQAFLDYAHAIGYDPQGWNELGMTYKKPVWIGAVDVTCILRSFNIPASIYDFSVPEMKYLHESMFEWVWQYFSQRSVKYGQQLLSFKTNKNKNKNKNNNNENDNSNNSNNESKQNASNEASNDKNDQNDKNDERRFVPPLYLQHQGHSRTIIGILYNRRSKLRHLLILDPSVKGGGMQLLSNIENGNIGNLKRSLKQIRQLKYQIVNVPGFGIMTNNDKNNTKHIASTFVPYNKDSIDVDWEKKMKNWNNRKNNSNNNYWQRKNNNNNNNNNSHPNNNNGNFYNGYNGNANYNRNHSNYNQNYRQYGNNNGNNSNNNNNNHNNRQFGERRQQSNGNGQNRNNNNGQFNNRRY